MFFAFFNEFHNLMRNPKNNPGNLVNYKYYDISQIKNLKSCDDNKSLFLFHLKKYSISKNFDDFQLLIQSTSIYFND